MLSGFHALSVDYFAGFTLEIEKISAPRPSETHSRMALLFCADWGYCHAFGVEHDMQAMKQLDPWLVLINVCEGRIGSKLRNHEGQQDSSEGQLTRQHSCTCW